MPRRKYDGLRQLAAAVLFLLSACATWWVLSFEWAVILGLAATYAMVAARPVQHHAWFPPSAEAVRGTTLPPATDPDLLKRQAAAADALRKSLGRKRPHT